MPLRTLPDAGPRTGDLEPSAGPPAVLPAAAGGPVQSVDRALRILSAFAAGDDVLTVGGLARLLDVHKSTASRLVATLAGAGFLERVGDDGLRLGDEVARLGRLAAPAPDLPALARAAMAGLAEATGETITLAAADGGDATTIAQTDSRYVVGAQSWVGRRSPLHATSDGKVLLAFGAAPVPPGPLEGRTPSTVTDRRALRRELDEVRRRGWAAATGDFEPGLNGVAAPIRDATGACRAALCVSGPAYRLTEADLPGVAERCRAAADGVTVLLSDGDDARVPGNAAARGTR